MSRKMILAGLPLLIGMHVGQAAAQTTPPVVAPAPAESQVPAAKGALAAAINAQDVAPGDQVALKRQLVRAQILLDRRSFSPGVIDGAAGSNMRRALAAFQEAESLPVNGTLDAATWERLAAGSQSPAIRGYVITAEDVAGPFAAPVTPGDFVTMAARPSMTWMSVIESLAERSHMDEALLIALNPGVDFSQAGTEIIVADTQRAALPTIASVVVEKGRNQLRAMDADGKIVAVYPATIGSRERPAPTGNYAVRTVAPAPNYTFDSRRLSFNAQAGRSSSSKAQKLTIQPGPNNPVGSSWIDLTLDTYGIHGTPHPRLIGKTASHGCVRLTNWDAAALAKAVKAGTRVEFTS